MGNYFLEAKLGHKNQSLLCDLRRVNKHILCTPVAITECAVVVNAPFVTVAVFFCRGRRKALMYKL